MLEVAPLKRQLLPDAPVTKLIKYLREGQDGSSLGS